MPNRAAAPPSPDMVPFLSRPYGKPLTLLLSVLLLTLSFAPTKQFYLAWVGLVPWFCVLQACTSQRRAFLWSWLGGTLFFIANMWWLAFVTVPGMLALVIYLGLYWGLAGVIVRGFGWMNSRASRALPISSSDSQLVNQNPPGQTRRGLGMVFGIAVVWVALEWIRGNFCTGLPWLYLGHTQSPLLLFCQVADIGGVYAITFWVVAVNAAVYYCIHREIWRWWAVGTVAILLVGIGGYGLFRQGQTARITTPGPRIMVVQPNFPQDNGNKGASEAEMVNFHLKATADGIKKLGRIDLACWSETMMPPLNDEFLSALSSAKEPGEADSPRDRYRGVVDHIHQLASENLTNIIAGGLYYGGLDFKDGKGAFTDRRNTAYLFRTDGSMDDDHYDKIHLVPFGEFVPFKGSTLLGWLHGIFMSMSPYNYDYTLTPGSADAPTVFRLNIGGVPGARVLTPICFEDIDAGLCAKLFRSPAGKRADLIVNLTNDGWFKANENGQHLQAAVFRSIENRVPTARSVNTGISGFIDSYGRVVDTVPVRAEGVAVQKVLLDPRYTLYTRVGDLFAWVCTLITGVLTISALSDRFSRRRHVLK